MKRIRYIQIGGLLLLAVILLFNLTDTAKIIPGMASQQASGKPIDVTIYLTTQSLKEIFQGRVNQALTGTLSGFMNKLPAQDRDSVTQIATTLLQPSAVLTDLQPQQGGLDATIKLSLYPGDSQPIEASMQIKFQAISSSEVQVSVTPLPGSPTLMSGSVASIQIPFGQLSSVATTPSCGASALALKLQFPLALGSSSTTSQPASPATPEQANGGSAMDVSVAIPASSLAEMGKSVGSIPINSMMTAQDITITVQKSSLNISTQLYWGELNIGSSSTDVEPTAEGGKLAVHVQSTTVKLWQSLTFPYNVYNQQVQQTLNEQLGNALPSTFAVTQAGIGPNTQISCVSGDNLMITGSATLG